MPKKRPEDQIGEPFLKSRLYLRIGKYLLVAGGVLEVIGNIPFLSNGDVCDVANVVVGLGGASFVGYGLAKIEEIKSGM